MRSFPGRRTIFIIIGVIYLIAAEILAVIFGMASGGSNPMPAMPPTGAYASMESFSADASRSQLMREMQQRAFWGQAPLGVYPEGLP